MKQNWILGIMFSVALLLAGSDGEWFPWPNLFGGWMLILVAWWISVMNRREFEEAE
jgi:hypothetical protein